MECQRCNTQNPDAAKFCVKCGTPLRVVGPASTTRPGQGIQGPSAMVELHWVRQLEGVLAMGAKIAVHIDGEEVDHVGCGQLAIYKVETGSHHIQLQGRGVPPMQWSPPLSFEVSEASTASFECGLDWLGRPWLRSKAD